MKLSLLFNVFLTGSVLTLGTIQLDQTNSKRMVTEQIKATEPIVKTPLPYSENTIQVALLLDTSNSMDGLIEQAKSKLWNIVNILTTLKYDGKTPKIEISLYEYGNDGLSDRNWVRKITPLTQDLDLISEKLFSLRTNGGTEYCGAVIKNAVDQLEWNNNPSAMKLVYIAGNEAFNQEGINYRKAIQDAKRKNIFVNTIFCGDREEGIKTFWQDGAFIGGGKYFNIDSNQKIIFIETPYDRKISECNLQLNNTYIGYGTYGQEKKIAQAVQDQNAASLSRSNIAERAITKTKKSAYNNASWDIIDKAEADKDFINKVKKEELPEELRNKTKQELAQYIAEKTKERERLQKEIATLAKQRQEYIELELKKTNTSDQDDLGKAIEKSIHEMAKRNGYTY